MRLCRFVPRSRERVGFFLDTYVVAIEEAGRVPRAQTQHGLALPAMGRPALHLVAP